MHAGPDGELPEALQKLEPAILELVCNEIVERSGRVQWDDIAGQDQAKRLVQELVVWPMLNPHLFKVSCQRCMPGRSSLYRNAALCHEVLRISLVEVLYVCSKAAVSGLL